MSSQQELLKGTIKIDGKDFDFDLNEQTKIQVDPASLNESLASSPNRYAVWAMLEHRSQVVYDDFKNAVDLAERELKTLEARIYLQIMGRGDKITIPMVQAMVQADPERETAETRIAELRKAMLEAKDRLGTCAVGRKAIEMKQEADIAWGYRIKREEEAKTSINVDRYRPGAGRQA